MAESHGPANLGNDMGPMNDKSHSRDVLMNEVLIGSKMNHNGAIVGWSFYDSFIGGLFCF